MLIVAGHLWHCGMSVQAHNMLTASGLANGWQDRKAGIPRSGTMPASQLRITYPEYGILKFANVLAPYNPAHVLVPTCCFARDYHCAAASTASRTYLRPHRIAAIASGVKITSMTAIA